ncbi:unnamed protein product [Prorocentrum cordatum]|uniref:Uncharacterized protein n=1 Tax=Prorocentrum cordatum TaxID=2364126 RepID=A0ABN9XU26_9DINO|nr:unnamed protein product [Polarella glacialis]
MFPPGQIPHLVNDQTCTSSPASERLEPCDQQWRQGGVRANSPHSGRLQPNARGSDGRIMDGGRGEEEEEEEEEGTLARWQILDCPDGAGGGCHCRAGLPARAPSFGRPRRAGTGRSKPRQRSSQEATLRPQAPGIKSLEKV